MKWIKRLILTLTLFLIGGIALASCGWYLFRGTPDWYKPNTATTQEQNDAAKRALNKVFEAQNWAAAVWARESAAHHAQKAGTTLSSSAPSSSITLSFTQEELNTFFNKWSDLYQPKNAKASLSTPYLIKPMIVLQKDRVILAGGMKELDGNIVSFHFQPRLNEQGQLSVELLKVMAGKLNLPEMVWSKTRERLERSVAGTLPWLQKVSQMDSNGAVNSQAMGAAISKMLLQVLNQQPTDGVAFLPLVGEGRGIPVKLIMVQVEDGELRLSAEPLDEKARAGLFRRIREPYVGKRNQD